MTGLTPDPTATLYLPAPHPLGSFSAPGFGLLSSFLLPDTCACAVVSRIALKLERATLGMPCVIVRAVWPDPSGPRDALQPP